jgi:hypothetical protein
LFHHSPHSACRAFIFLLAFLGCLARPLEVRAAEHEETHEETQHVVSLYPQLTVRDVEAVRLDAQSRCSNAWYADTLFELGFVPRAIRDDLWERGWHLDLCHSVADNMRENGVGAFSDGAHTTWTWDNVAAVTLGLSKRIVFGEVFLGGKRRDNKESLLHEMGHAFDFSRGLSDSPAGLAAWNADTAGAAAPAHDIKIEVFADVFQIAVSSRNVLEPADPQMALRYPRVYALVVEAMQQVTTAPPASSRSHDITATPARQTQQNHPSNNGTPNGAAMRMPPRR